jgi:hypothetical protein
MSIELISFFTHVYGDTSMPLRCAVADGSVPVATGQAWFSMALVWDVRKGACDTFGVELFSSD